ncbi:MAG: pseudouridine synthase [Patescibacteria group bacterium]
MGTPIRINRYLALNQYCSRREADKLIEQGQVLINGKPAVLGMLVKENDKISLRSGFKKVEAGRVYLAFNKPVGIVSHGPEGNQKSIGDIFRYKTRVFPVGRLDKDSHGLIILSNDGRITGRLLDPEFEHEKEYLVEVDKSIQGGFLKKMSGGVRIGDSLTRPCRVSPVGSNKFRIILTEGKKRQIRKMCLALNYVVKDLKRVRILNIELGNLKPGGHREIKDEELSLFLSAIGIRK